MSAIGFDTLKFARKLKDAGVPEEQAEAQAEVLGEAFLYNLDEIVTRDCLDSRLAPINMRLDAIESRLDSMEIGLESRMDSIEIRLNRMDQRFVAIDGKFRLMFWMQGVIIAVVVIPALTRLLG